MKKNPIVHFEIYADDPEKLGQFYTNLFDWSIEAMPEMDYRYIETIETDAEGMPKQSPGINGGLMKRPAGAEGLSWINYIGVDSIEETIKRAEKLGAKLMKEKSAVPGMGWFAILSDPQGNHFAIWKMDKKAK
ncbi:MAG: VOC family protein [Smithellaceae bacterium]|nr:VOC family protein [Smithellaceae bacterium]